MPDNEIESVVDPYGWIKLNRKIRKNDFWENAGPFDLRSAWIDLLLSVSYEQSEVYEHGSKCVIKIEPGQILTSLKRLAETWKWSYGKVSRYLDNLQDMGMITQNRTTKYTVITITNWGKYQGQSEKPKPEQKPAPQPNANKAWEEMTPAEQAAYLRR